MTCNSSHKRWSKGGITSCHEHQKVQKRSQKINRVCRLETKEEAVMNASKTGDCCMEALRQQVIALRANRVEVMFQRFRETGAAQGLMPGRKKEGTVKDGQEQDKASQQLALSASSACNEGTPASRLELDLPSPSRRPMDEE